MSHARIRTLSVVSLVLAFTAVCAFAATSDTADPVKEVEGFWAYTGIVPPGGKDIPMTGIILFKDGMFAQQSVYDGQPFQQQGAMGHAGPFSAGPMGVHMMAQQTISISPDKNPPLSFRADTPHDVSVERSGDVMKFVFDTGTVQTFKRIGPAAGKVYKLERGLLAFIDGHFVLVDGDANGVVTGYGTFTRKGTDYDLKIIRWAESKGDKALNRRDDSLQASFDGKVFTLADGRSFRVVPH